LELIGWKGRRIGICIEVMWKVCCVSYSLSLSELGDWMVSKVIRNIMDNIN